MSMRDEWFELRNQKEAEIEEAERVKMPPTSDRAYSMTEERKRITDEMIELMERGNGKGAD